MGQKEMLVYIVDHVVLNILHAQSFHERGSNMLLHFFQLQLVCNVAV